MDLSALLEILSGGADAALIAIAFAIWRLDRRVLKLETKLEGKIYAEKDPQPSL